MTWFVRIGILFSIGLASTRAAPPIGLSDGESFTYRVSWIILPGAGEITLNAEAAANPTGAPLLRVSTHTSTRGLARLILPFDARGESLFDRSTNHLVWLGESSNDRGKRLAHTVSFDYKKNVAIYTVTEGQASTRALPMPPGYPSDLISCLVQARTWNLRPGEARDALVLFEDEFYQLTIHALGYESVLTPTGTVNALVLEPRMERTPPKGMFKHGSTVRVWIGQDPRRLPVRFKVGFNFGSGVANLESYHPPASR